jgi:hypothetical protein
MRLTIELEPEQLFTSYLNRNEVEEVYEQILKQYRDETLLWNLISKTLDTILSDYRDEQEWYVQRQIDTVFDGKEEYAVDNEVIVESEKYTRAAEKIKSMVVLLREGKVDDVIGH